MPHCHQEQLGGLLIHIHCQSLLYIHVQCFGVTIGQVWLAAQESVVGPCLQNIAKRGLPNIHEQDRQRLEELHPNSVQRLERQEPVDKHVDPLVLGKEPEKVFAVLFREGQRSSSLVDVLHQRVSLRGQTRKHLRPLGQACLDALQHRGKFRPIQRKRILGFLCLPEGPCHRGQPCHGS